MKTILFGIDGKKKNEIELPKQFNESIREDIIKRVFHAIQSNKRQPYGPSKDAGKRASVRLSKRRRDYRGTYGYGISRTPRKILSRRGLRFYWVGAFAPQTVGGRRAHPPKPIKRIEKVNKKERRKAIRSAISATIIKDIVSKRGHIVPENYPIIIESKIEGIEKTKEAKEILKLFNLEKELKRAEKKKIRAGKGKIRGRKYKKKKGPLVVVSKKCPLIRALGNVPGVNVVSVKNLNVKLLAPGAVPGRLTIWTDKAIELMKKENIFMG